MRTKLLAIAAAAALAAPALATSDVCPWDLDADGEVGVNDLVTLVLEWGDDCFADINGDGACGVEDMVEIILNRGPCP